VDFGMVAVLDRPARGDAADYRRRARRPESCTGHNDARRDMAPRRDQRTEAALEPARGRVRS
jgi:hypothetical protein